MPKLGQSLIIDTWGSYLHIEKGVFILKDRWGELKKHPFNERELGEVWIRNGNAVSVDALTALASWNVDVVLATQYRKPVAMLRSLDDDSYVTTRVNQYESLKDERGRYIAKQLVLSKIEGQRRVLEKWGFKERYKPKSPLEGADLKQLRRRCISIEGNYAKKYYESIFTLFPEKIRPTERRTYKAYEGLNNVFNLAYEFLKWKCHSAIINAKLEPFLGYLHAPAFAKPSLVCDLQELYRYLIDDYLIKYCQGLKLKDFEVRAEAVSKGKVVMRVFLSDFRADELAEGVNGLFERSVRIPRIRRGDRQTLNTLVREEAQLLAKYLREERKTGVPRLPSL